MTVGAPGAVGRAPVLPRILGPIRPRPRWQEARLLALAALALLVGSVSLGATVNGSLAPADPRGLAIYLGALVAAHVAQVLAGRRTDQVLLPVVGLLGGISLLLMERLPQDLVTQTFFGTELGSRPGPAGLAARGPDRRHDARDRRPLRCLAAPLQVHVGRGRRRAAPADVRARDARSTARA